ncbi:MAG: hypothetical protein HRU18_00800 [Pseudoalteromonas sp.]|uniref:hypothetical protein n=1 Tax=Pseudoalteromonas sp. TaxID=53249 RepID=UPI001DC7B4F7|nr:hypothetical protein [Pseudoalteromonas sp.]NRA76718.1 hypothetical protein [Pseudoalteromonas sp.]
MNFNQQAMELIVDNEQLRAKANELTKSLELHIKVLGDLYPSDAKDINECNLSEFIAVHKLTTETKELLNKTPEQCLNSVKADAIEGAFMSIHSYDCSGKEMVSRDELVTMVSVLRL